MKNIILGEKHSSIAGGLSFLSFVWKERHDYIILSEKKLNETIHLERNNRDTEIILYTLIKSLENKHLNPGILDPLNPFSQPIGRQPDILSHYQI